MTNAQNFAGLLLVAAASVACAAPIGLGPGAVPLTENKPGQGSAVAGVAVNAGGETFQAELAGIFLLKRNFAIGAGLAYTAQHVEWDERAVTAHSVLPYLTPTLVVGDFRIGTPLSGFAWFGPGGGIFYGLFGVQAGYGGDNWGVEASWLTHTFDNLDYNSSSQRFGLGGHFQWTVSGVVLGVMPEIAYTDVTILSGPNAYDKRGVEIVIKLRVGTAVRK